MQGTGADTQSHFIPGKEDVLESQLPPNRWLQSMLPGVVTSLKMPSGIRRAALIAIFLTASFVGLGLQSGTAHAAPLATTQSVAAATSSAPATTTLTLTFTCAVAYDYSYAHVCVHTHANAALTIRVRYCSGYYATSSSLRGVHYANSYGNYTWSWTPMTNCRGWAKATVTSTYGGQSITAYKTFYVH